MTTAAPAYLSQFAHGNVTRTIPGARGRFQWPAAARPSTVPTINGSFDVVGTGAAGFQLPYQLAYTGAAVDATDTTVVQDALDGLRADVGAFGRLYMTLADGTMRWAQARLVSVSPDMVATDRAVITFAAIWQIASIWYGDAHGDVHGDGSMRKTPLFSFANGLYPGLTDMQTLYSTDPTVAVTLWNGGNALVPDCGILIQAGSADLTYLKFTLPNVAEMEFTGTVAAGAYLFIDCGARVIENDGVAAFKDWRRTANHYSDKWLPLEPGNNYLAITMTGGSTDSLIVATYSDGWT